MNFQTSIRKGNEVLQAIMNVRALSNLAKLEKVPFTQLTNHLVGALPGREGGEMETAINVVFCAIEEGFRYYRKPCPYVIDDIWDWFMSNESECTDALMAIMSVIGGATEDLPKSEEQGKK